MPGRTLQDQDEIARRHALGQDGYDEVWEGVYHVVPMAHSRHGEVQAELLSVLRPYATAAGFRVSGPFNLGTSDQDFRVPDGALFRADPDAVYVPTVPLVIEVLSPGDETFAKFPFYAARQVAEILVADRQERTVCAGAAQVTPTKKTTTRLY